MIVSGDSGTILKALYSSLMSTFPGIKIGKSLTFSISPESRMVQIFQSTSFKDITGCGSFSNTYKSVCDYLGIQPLQSVLWDIEYLYPANGIREFNLSEVYQYSPPDLKAILISLGYNTYFTSFQVNSFKLSTEDMTQLSELFQLNTSIQQLSLTNNQVSKESMIHLFTTLSENKALHLNHINVNNNFLENKGLMTLGAAIQTFTTPLNYLNIESTGSSAKGLEALFTCLVAAPIVLSSLNHLNIANNKLEAPGTVALCRFLSKASVLQTLNISHTSPVFSQLKTSASSLLSIDFSGNRPSTTKEGVLELLQFFKQMPNLNTLSLAKTQISGDDLKLLFSPATQLTKVANVDLSENELGDAGIMKLCEIMYPNSNLRHLCIDGNFKTKSKLRQRAIDAVINLIEDNNNIESLSIAAGNSKYQLKADLVPFIVSLLKNESLTKLDISGNGVGDSGALALCKVLWKNVTLKSVKMDGNDFTWTALKMIKNAIKRNPRSVTLLPLPLGDIQNVLKNDNATQNQEKLQKTLIELQYSVINNYKTQQPPEQPQQPAVKTSPLRKPITSSGTSTSSSSSSKIGFSTLPIKRPVKGPLYPGRSTISNAGSDKQSGASGTNQPDLPLLVSRSVELLIDRGTKSVGIFRTCASASQLKKIKARFEAGEDVDLKAENVDVDTVAGVLKTYFRELPTPLFPEVLHESFYQAYRQPTVPDKIKLYKEIIDNLTPIENLLAKRLFLLLHLISLEKQENMMPPENIAICFSPTLFRSFESELLPINAFLIVHYYDIFAPELKPKSPESLPLQDLSITDKTSISDKDTSSTNPSVSNVISDTPQVPPRSPKAFAKTITNNNMRKSTGNALGTSSGSLLMNTNSSSSTSTSNSNSSSTNSSNNNSPVPSPPSSPVMDGTQTLRSKRFSRVSRISYSPNLPRAFSNESRTISSLFQDSDFTNETETNSGTSV